VLVGPAADGVQAFVRERNDAIVAALESGKWPVRRRVVARSAVDQGGMICA
jgi:hypothetical protein